MVEPENVTDPLDPHAAFSDAEVGRLLEEYRPRLRRLLVLRLNPRLRGRIEPADVLQETFTEVVQRLGEYRTKRPMPFFLWVRLLTVQKVSQLHQHHLGAARRDAGREVIPNRPPASTASLAEVFAGPGPTPSQEAARGEIFTRVRQALDCLAEADHEVLALRYFERLTLEETALVMGISASGVSKRQLRALGRLKRELPRMEDVPTPP